MTALNDSNNAPKNSDPPALVQKIIAWCPDDCTDIEAREYTGETVREIAEQHAEHLYYGGTCRDCYDVRVRATKGDRVREWDVTVDVEVEVSFSAAIAFPVKVSKEPSMAAAFAELDEMRGLVAVDVGPEIERPGDRFGWTAPPSGQDSTNDAEREVADKLCGTDLKVKIVHDDDMKPEYNFAGAERGKFHRPGASVTMRPMRPLPLAADAAREARPCVARAHGLETCHVECLDSATGCVVDGALRTQTRSDKQPEERDCDVCHAYANEPCVDEDG